MQLFHTYHQNKFQRIIHSDFWLFEFSVWLHTFSRSMIAVFIPILLLQTGYSIGDVMLYYFIYNLIDVPWNLITRWLIHQIGARKVIILGSLASVLFFIGLFNLTADNWTLLLLIALLGAIYDTFYWIAHLYLFMKCSDNDKNMSEDASILSIVRSIAGILAPALGAVVMIFFSEKVLIITSVSILILSIIPLFKIHNIPDKPKRKSKSFKQFFNNLEISKDYVFSALFSVHSAIDAIVWPLFIYLFFNNIESVAVLPMIASITTIIVTYLAGKAKKEKRVIMMIYASLLISILWCVRLFVDNISVYYLSVFFVGFLAVLVRLPLDSYIFEKGEKKDALSTSTWRNFIHMFMSMWVFGFLYLVIDVFKVGFVVAAISMLFLTILIVCLSIIFLHKKKRTFSF